MRRRRPGERDDHRAALRAIPVLAVLTAATTFGPWGSSGQRSRTSYEIVEVAGRAGVVPGSLEPVATAWFLIPVLLGLVLVAVAAGRARLAAFLAATLGAFVTTGGMLVARSPLALEAGAVLGIVTGGLTVSVAVVVVLTTSNSRAGHERPVGSDQQR